MSINVDLAGLDLATDGVTKAFNLTGGSGALFFVSGADLNAWYEAADGTVTALIYNTDFTIAGDGTTGNGVLTTTAATAYATGGFLHVRRATPRTQPESWANNDGFPPKTLERAQDRGRLIDQELAQGLAHALKAPAWDTPPGDLPSQAARANGGDGSVGSYDGSGNPALLASTPGEIDAVVADKAAIHSDALAAAASASAAAGSASAAAVGAAQVAPRIVQSIINDPPGAPADNDAHLIGDAGTGVWAGKENQLALYAGGWKYFDADNGFVVVVSGTGETFRRGGNGSWRCEYVRLSVTDDVVAANAQAVARNTPLLIDSRTAALSADTTITAKHVRYEGGQIDQKPGATSYKLTFTGRVDFSGQPSYVAAFDTVQMNAGNVIFDGVVEGATPENMFGAAADGVTDDAAALTSIAYLFFYGRAAKVAMSGHYATSGVMGIGANISGRVSNHQLDMTGGSVIPIGSNTPIEFDDSGNNESYFEVIGMCVDATQDVSAAATGGVMVKGRHYTFRNCTVRFDASKVASSFVPLHFKAAGDANSAPYLTNAYGILIVSTSSERVTDGIIVEGDCNGLNLRDSDISGADYHITLKDMLGTDEATYYSPNTVLIDGVRFQDVGDAALRHVVSGADFISGTVLKNWRFEPLRAAKLFKATGGAGAPVSTGPCLALDRGAYVGHGYDFSDVPNGFTVAFDGKVITKGKSNNPLALGAIGVAVGAGATVTLMTMNEPYFGTLLGNGVSGTLHLIAVGSSGNQSAREFAITIDGYGGAKAEENTAAKQYNGTDPLAAAPIAFTGTANLTLQVIAAAGQAATVYASFHGIGVT